MVGHYFAAALRGFARNPLSTAIKLLALSLGLVCLLTAHVIGDHFRQADRQWEKAARTYVVVQETARPGGGWESTSSSAAPAVAQYLRVDFPELEAVARLYMGGAAVRAPGQDISIPAFPVDPEFLDIFDLDMLAGEASVAPRTALIEERAAQSLFGDANPIGQTLTLNESTDVTVAGVFRQIAAPSQFSSEGGLPVQMLVSMQTFDDSYVARISTTFTENGASFAPPRPSEIQDFRQTYFLTYVTLPADGALTREQFQARLDRFAERRVPDDVEGMLEVRFRAAPVWSVSEERFNQRVGTLFGASIVTALYALGALTLAVGCINFANLSVAQAATRAREIGLRKTVGATRRQIALQMLVETATLVIVALALVLPLAALLAQEFGDRFFLTLSLPGVSHITYWGGVFGIAAAVALAAGVYPAVVMANLRPVFAMRLNSLRGSSGAVRTLLIGAQFAAAAFLVVMVVVMLAQKSDLQRIASRPGEDPIVTLSFSPVQTGFAFGSGVEDYLESVRQQLLASPAITGVTFRNSPAFAEAGEVSEFAQSLDPGARRFPAQGRTIYYDYFETTGVEIVAGREYSREENDARSVIIDTGTAEIMGMTPQQAIGQPVYRVAAREGTVDVAGGQTDPYEFRIVGVVEREPLELTSVGPGNFVYILQPVVGAAIVRLSKDNVEGGLAYVTDVWRQRAAPPGAPSGSAALPQPVFLDESFADAYRSFNMINVVFILLSGIAVAIAAMGLFGLANFVVQRRMREIGVRKTLGASGGSVVRLVLWDFSRPVIVANLVAIPFAYVAARIYLNQFVARIDLTPLPFVMAFGATLLIAWIAVGAQAVRAARVNPALILKSE